MFSALFSSQNSPVLIITINSASFQYSNDETTWTNIPIDGKTITYDSLNYQVRLLSVEPADATYSSSIPLPISQQGQTAQAVITGTGSYTGSIISPNLTVIASAITIAPSGSTSFSYNGSSKTVGYTVSGVYEADTNYAVSETSSTNAGSYTASLTTTSSNYVLGTTTNIPWTITKALLTLTTSNKSMTYGSSVPTQTFGYSLSGLLGGDTAAVITGAASHSTTGTSSSNVGSYPITTIFGTLSATNYSFAAVNGTLTISAATLTASTRTGSATYNGAGQAVTVLSGINGTTFTGSTSVSGTNAGSYTTTITGTGNHTGSVTGTLTIGKAILTITTSNASMTYGYSVPVFTHTPTGFVNSETAAVITGTVTHSTTGSSSSNVGNYSITPSVSGLTATNYIFTPVNGTLTISPATLTASFTTGSATYNGSLQAVTVLSGINGTFSGSTSVSGTNVGSYSTTITGTGNYTGSVTGTLTINRAALAVSNTTGSATYNGSSQAVTVLSGIIGTFSGSTSVSGTNAGSYTTTITGTGNYTGFVTGTLTISPATLTALLIGGSATYTGSSQTVTVLSGINGTYSGSTSVSGTNAGSYTTTITGTGNYTGSVTGILTISPATLTASFTTGSATYNGSSQSVTVISGINGTYSGSTSVSGTNVGSYSTTITGTGNYTGSVTGTLTINRATLTASSISSYETYNRGQQSFTISGINGTYSGSPTVYGTGVGSYSTTIYGTGNYTGSVTGTLNIRTDSGYVDIFYGGVHDASRTSEIFVPVRTSNAAFTVTHSVSGPGAADARHTSFGLSTPHDWNGLYVPVPPGAVVRNTNPQTQGFVVTITAAINDSNYSFMSATTSVTVNAYSAPSGGFITE